MKTLISTPVVIVVPTIHTLILPSKNKNPDPLVLKYSIISAVVHQNYEPRVIDEDVLRGNSAIVKCLIPSFVADYVQVVEWLTDEESLSVFSPNDPEGNYGNRDHPRVPDCPHPFSTRVLLKFV